jgi:hypothetical protein
MRFFPEGLYPFKIQTRFQLEFSSEIYNSKSRGILKLGQKGKLFHLKLSITLPNLDNFRPTKGCVLYFQI